MRLTALALLFICGCSTVRYRYFIADPSKGEGIIVKHGFFKEQEFVIYKDWKGNVRIVGLCTPGLNLPNIPMVP